MPNIAVDQPTVEIPIDSAQTPQTTGTRISDKLAPKTRRQGRRISDVVGALQVHMTAVGENGFAIDRSYNDLLSAAMAGRSIVGIQAEKVTEAIDPYADTEDPVPEGYVPGSVTEAIIIIYRITLEEFHEIEKVVLPSGYDGELPKIVANAKKYWASIRAVPTNGPSMNLLLLADTPNAPMATAVASDDPGSESQPVIHTELGDKEWP